MLENLILAPIWACWTLIRATFFSFSFFFFFFEVSALLDARHCPIVPITRYHGQLLQAPLRILHRFGFPEQD